MSLSADDIRNLSGQSCAELRCSECGLLMKTATQIVAFFLIALALFLMGLWALGWIPSHANYCEYNQYTEHEKCASYHVTIVAIRYIAKLLDDIAPALTAPATVLIGVFTATIWQANKEQIRHNRQTERAYLWPGFAGHLRGRAERGGAIRNISILNTGHTAGTLNEIHHALVSENDFKAGQFHNVTTRSGEIIPPARPGEESTGTRISCGYIVYTDVYRDRHEQAWKHRLHATGASEALAGCYSDPPDKNH